MGKQTDSNVAESLKQTVSKQISRRKHRVPLFNRRKKARIYILDETGEALDFEKYRLSPFGAYLYSEYLHCTGEKLQLEILLPDQPEPLLINAEVIRADMDNEAGMGVAFRDMNSSVQRRLKNYIAGNFLREINNG